jgi:hypothetical protein
LTITRAELELRRLLLDQDLAVEGQPRDARFRPHRLDDPQPVRLGKLERRVCCEVKPGRGVEHREAERLLADRHRRGQSSQRRKRLVDPLRGDHAGLDVNDVMALRPVEAEDRALVGAPRGKHHPPPGVWLTGHQRRNLGPNVAAFQCGHHQPALPGTVDLVGHMLQRAAAASCVLAVRSEMRAGRFTLSGEGSSTAISVPRGFSRPRH